MTEPVKYQYHTSDGKEIWIAFDPARACVYCEQPVRTLSMGGPAVCSSCDCGNHRDGSKWTIEEYPSIIQKARRNIDALTESN